MIVCTHFKIRGNLLLNTKIKKVSKIGKFYVNAVSSLTNAFSYTRRKNATGHLGHGADFVNFTHMTPFYMQASFSYRNPEMRK